MAAVLQNLGIIVVVVHGVCSLLLKGVGACKSMRDAPSSRQPSVEVFPCSTHDCMVRLVGAPFSICEVVTRAWKFYYKRYSASLLRGRSSFLNDMGLSLLKSRQLKWSARNGSQILAFGVRRRDHESDNG